jgi:hypothetical protein
MGWISRATQLAAIFVTLALAAGCTRQAVSGKSAGPQQLPFDRVSPRGGLSPTASLEPAYVPAGTLLSIRMQSAVSSANAQPGDLFDAVLDAPLIVQGEILAPAGSSVSGKVVSAKSSSAEDDPGYLRLTLTTISIHGRKLSLQTSSLFAKASSSRKTPSGSAMAFVGAISPVSLGGPADKANIEIRPDRTLTFRLTGALPLHQVLGPITSE